MPFECLTYERKDETCYLTFKRPDKLNALNVQLMAECEKIAKKISLLSPVGVNMTKVSVNRALEGMGFLSAISNNLELMIHFDISSGP